MKKNFILGIFDDEEELVHACEKVAHDNVEIYDVYTPFPVHGLDDLLKIKRSHIPYVTFGAGLFGCSFAFAFQIFVSAIDWPMNIGGKPAMSITAFIPVGFELTILFAALSSVAAFFAAAKLFPGKPAVIFDDRQTCHKFILAIEDNSAVDSSAVQGSLKDLGASEVKLSEQ
jgi:hypothetical protein